MKDNYILCLDLLSCNSEDNFIALLKTEGYWDIPELWRHYGDVENNWGQSGSQQNLAETALAEKIVNSVDARLINECYEHGMEPTDPQAPQSVQAAIARFFEDGSGDRTVTGGLIENWGHPRIREIAEGITLCVTGTRPESLNITIADCGEGQTPTRLPDTILSLSKNNKLYIPFVQGQFNQGGSGALRFCGKHSLQLVVSRRNPKLLKESSTARAREWGFTIVRRERPSGNRKNSKYTYLAPVGVDKENNPHRGDVLSFSAKSFPIFPNDNGPYARETGYGTAIKMFNYRFVGEKSNILRGKSLLSRLDLLLPKIALPVRLYEYRTNKKGEFLDIGSRRTTLSGLLRRLIDNEKNVEDGFPIAVPLHFEGEKLVVHIFAFRPGGARSYRRREGVVFMRNGQTQGNLPKDFFRRDAVKMKPLADDLLVFVDCDELSNFVREYLFMTNRTQLVDNKFKKDLVDNLQKTIHDCTELKELRHQRQKERTSEQLKNEQPFTDVLQALIKNSPNLRTLLELGERISAPFDTRPTKSDPEGEFQGEFYPTYFKTKRINYGTIHKRPCPINQGMRFNFETDARDDYFTRFAECGSFELTWIGKDGNERKTSWRGPKLKSGSSTVTLVLPDDVAVGDEIEFIARVRDSFRKFENRFIVNVKPKSKPKDNPNPPAPKPAPPGSEDGKRREGPLSLALPRIKRVYREQWDENDFDELTAMKVECVDYTKDEKTEIYEFKVNMDNIPLANEATRKHLDVNQYEVLRQRFLYANVLIGLSLLHDEKQSRLQPEDEGDMRQEHIEARIDRTCRALAPFLPAIFSLGTGELGADDRIDGLEEAV